MRFIILEIARSNLTPVRVLLETVENSMNRASYFCIIKSRNPRLHSWHFSQLRHGDVWLMLLRGKNSRQKYFASCQRKKSLMPSLPTFFPALGFVDKNYFTFRGKMFDCYDYFCNFANLIPTGWTRSIRNLLKFC